MPRHTQSTVLRFLNVNNKRKRVMFQPVVGYEGVYEIDQTGLVRRCGSKKVLSTNYCQSYAYVSLSVNNKQKRMNIHRMVAMAFIPNDGDKEQVNHINGNKHDNRLSNLEWVTRSENAIHAWATGLIKPTEKFLKQVANNGRMHSRCVVGTHKITGDTIEFESAMGAARHLNGHQGNITLCCQGKKKTIYGYKWRYKNG